jgi:hypothetical protein
MRPHGRMVVKLAPQCLQLLHRMRLPTSFRPAGLSQASTFSRRKLMMHRSWPADLISGGGSCVIAAKDNRRPPRDQRGRSRCNTVQQGGWSPHDGHASYRLRVREDRLGATPFRADRVVRVRLRSGEGNDRDHEGAPDGTRQGPYEDKRRSNRPALPAHFEVLKRQLALRERWSSGSALMDHEHVSVGRQATRPQRALDAGRLCELARRHGRTRDRADRARDTALTCNLAPAWHQRRATHATTQKHRKYVAEREGFEPSMGF